MLLKHDHEFHALDLRIEMKVYDHRNFFSATQKQQRERGLKSSERDSNSEACDAGAVSDQSAIVMLVDN